MGDADLADRSFQNTARGSDQRAYSSTVPKSSIRATKQRRARRAPGRTFARCATAKAASCIRAARIAAAAEKSCAGLAAPSQLFLSSPAQRPVIADA